MKEEAFRKLEAPLDSSKLSRCGKLVSGHVIAALKEFCEQNSEFAQAIAQSDKTVAQCVEAAVKGASSYLSDIEVYRRAAAFWFEGATVRFTMTIDLGDNGFSNDLSAADSEETVSDTTQIPEKRGLSLSLDELLK